MKVCKKVTSVFALVLILSLLIGVTVLRQVQMEIIIHIFMTAGVMTASRRMLIL